MFKECVKKRVLISVESLVENTSIDKVMKCYDFQKWEVEETLSLKNTQDYSLNRFRWMYILETLQITQDVKEVGEVALNLISDIQLGYHKIPHDVIYADIEGEKDVLSEYTIESLNFEFRPLVNGINGKIEYIELCYNNNTEDSLVESEMNEILEYLGVKQLKSDIDFY